MKTSLLKIVLPTEIPIFPLPGAVLFPHGTLPLNIFEPRYIAMVESLGSHRMIGMIQPVPEEKLSQRFISYRLCRKNNFFTETNDSRY